MKGAVHSTRLSRRVGLITGAGSGIGRATANLMAMEGAVVIVADIDFNAAVSVVEEIAQLGGTAEAIELDVSKDLAWQAAIGNVLAKHKHLDILVNNAGISISRSVADSSFDEWRRVMAVNLDGVFLGCHHAITAMSNGGSIVNIASVSGMKPSGGGASAYCASKAAVRIFSKALAMECVDANNCIRVHVVTPGGVKTPMWQKEEFFQALVAEQGGVEEAFAALAGDVPAQQFFTPEDVAKTVLYLVSDESLHLTGVEIVLDRGYHL